MRRLCNLPRLNPNATRLLAVSMDVETALAEFEAIFNSDPSLAAEILRLANSAEFGLRARVTNIRFALTLLGTERTRSLAFSIVMSRYPRGGLGKADTLPFWLHSIATALIAEEMGRTLRSHIPLVYTAGLTHDLGRLGMLLTDREQYADYLTKQFRTTDEADRLEKLRFGFSHGEAGAFLAQTWQFPPILCQCIKTHHDVMSADEEELVQITQEACVMASELGFPELPNCPTSLDASPLGADLRKRVAPVSGPMRDAVKQRAAMF
jgi:putative nucleotidyltransferase with HDIG domain